MKSTQDTPPTSDASAAPPPHQHALAAAMLIIIVACASLMAVIYGASQASMPKLTVTNSGCVKTFREAKEGITGTEWIGNHIILHMSIIDNCCIDNFAVDWAISGLVIQVNIRSVSTQTCRCFCPFMVHVDLGPLPSGQHHIDVFHGENVVGEVSGVLGQ